MQQEIMHQGIIEGSVPGFTEFCRKVAAEGAVLLKNEQAVLPLRQGDKVSLFGRAQIDWYRSGTGSGGSVNVEYKTNLLGALRDKDGIDLNESLVQVYEQWIEKNPYDDGGTGWATEPWFQKEMQVSSELVAEARQASDKAIVIIGRTAGEDKDNSTAPGSYKLTEDEMDLLSKVAEQFEQIILVLNTSNIIDMSWLKGQSFSERLSGVIYVWQGGMEGGNAAADVLLGDVTPSGKLTDTIAWAIEDYPSTGNYNGVDKNLYQEDVYVGYRYFETFNPAAVQFEFGFGLSYTSFEIRAVEGEVVTEEGEEQIVFDVTVRNTGEQFSGKEVVQLYFEAPQGQLGKPARVLCGFVKTSELEVGASEKLTLKVPVKTLASYDDSGVTGFRSAYVLEAGDYNFYIGNSVKNVVHIGVGSGSAWNVAKTRIVEQLEEVMAPVEPLNRMKPGVRKTDGSYELVYEAAPERTVSMAERIQNRMPEEFAPTGDQGYTLRDVYDGKVTMQTFIAQLSDEELATIVRGEGMSSPWVTPGTASAFGGISQSLFDKGIPIACTADGPSGIRMDGGGTATQMPIGTLLAATWSIEMVEELYRFEGQELVNYQIDTLLGPGLNIRRSPLNGRNFEYFSEDPLITGALTVAAVKGIMTYGSNATLKHFACNNQEEHRTLVDAVVSERALREIYLKGFEMAVKDAGANCIMTAYNPINGHWTASNYDLNTTVLRNEWGFKGMVMTDWWAKMNDPIKAGQAEKNYTNHMVRSQNDVYMVVNNFGAEVNASNDNTAVSLDDGSLNRAELQRCAMNICDFLMKCPAFFRKQKFEEKIESFDSDESLAVPDAFDISTGGRLQLSESGKTLLKVSEPGTYRVYTAIMSEASNQAQLEGCLLLNGKRMALIQTNGTGGEWVSKQLQKVDLEKGFYCQSFEYIRSGMKVEWLEFKKMGAN